MIKAGKKIVFLDSGIGGLPYLEWVRQQIPEENFFYIADRGFFPYGLKSAEELTSHLIDLTREIILRFDPSLIVLACNTASVTALSSLRQEFSLPFVGVVPALKPAAKDSTMGSIGIMATPRTVKGVYLNKLEEQFAENCKILHYPAANIIDFIENDYYKAGSAERKIILDDVVSFFKDKVDTVVLGCTHFLHMKDLIQNNLGPKIKVIDSVEGVGRQVIRLLRETTQNNLLQEKKSAAEACNGTGCLYYTKQKDLTLNKQKQGFEEFSSDLSSEESYRFFADRFNLTFKGVF